MHSHQKQIIRLLEFVQELSNQGCQFYTREGHVCDCFPCRAKAYLVDEPIRLNTTTYGLLESPRTRKENEL